ncbi:unnamed protein product [Echinostoma caproni]|uniref:Velvet domain-containing protein n=1 Tax=Echinostoma caproni TaxID=27848 RepID=A0A183BCE2_9TREM|nr:unnamed protein product [Echinostoma caproni]
MHYRRICRIVRFVDTFGSNFGYTLLLDLFRSYTASMPCIEFILQLNKQASKCNYGDRLEEERFNRPIAGIHNISLQHWPYPQGMPNAQVQPHRFPSPTSDENSSPMYTLKTAERNGQFVFAPPRFESAHSPSILGFRAMRLRQGSITLYSNNDMPFSSHLQHLIVQCSDNVGGMKVPSVKLEMDGESIFLKRRVFPYGQREGILKASQKME